MVKKSELSKKDNKNGVCENEAKVRAFMMMLSVKEGTTGKIGYKKIFEHKDFARSPYIISCFADLFLVIICKTAQNIFKKNY